MSNIHPLSPAEATRTLVAEIGPCVDSIRQIATDLGARPYRLFLVRTQWTGEEEGDGLERVISEREFLPTPKVMTVGALSTEVRAAGQLEVGDLKIRDISISWKEWELRGVQEDGTDLPEGQKVFFEVRMDARAPTSQTLRRRFAMSGVPEMKISHWVITLKKALGDRTNDGRTDDGSLI